MLSRVNFPYFHIAARIKRYFILFSVYNAVHWGKHTQIQGLLAYEFSINQCVWHPQKYYLGSFFLLKWCL